MHNDAIFERKILLSLQIAQHTFQDILTHNPLQWKLHQEKQNSQEPHCSTRQHIYGWQLILHDVLKSSFKHSIRDKLSGSVTFGCLITLPCTTTQTVTPQVSLNHRVLITGTNVDTIPTHPVGTSWQINKLLRLLMETSGPNSLYWPLVRSCPSSLSPPPAVWWRCLWLDPSGSSSSNVSHICIKQTKISQNEQYKQSTWLCTGTVTHYFQ